MFARRTRTPIATFAATLSFVACVALLLGWLGAQLGEEVWVRFVRSGVLLHGASGEGIAWSRMYFFKPPAVGDPTFEGANGLVAELRAGNLQAPGGSFAGIEYYVDAGHPVPTHRTVVVHRLSAVADSGVAGDVDGAADTRKAARGSRLLRAVRV